MKIAQSTVLKCAPVLGLRLMGKSFQEIKDALGLRSKDQARALYAKGLYIRRCIEGDKQQTDYAPFQVS